MIKEYITSQHTGYNHYPRVYNNSFIAILLGTLCACIFPPHSPLQTHYAMLIYAALLECSPL